MRSFEDGDEQVLIFHAGAGYGKTTVMAQWAAAHSGKSCWYHLHESDNDPCRFLLGIAASFSDAVKADVFDMEELSQAGCADLPAVSERFFSKCFSLLPGESFYICLDDFHLIKNEAVQEFLLSFMEYGEGRVRFLVTAKESFPAFLAAGIMRGRAREVGADELRFAQCETGLLLEQIIGKKLSARVESSVQEYTRGWAAGIVFAGLGLKNGGGLTTAASYGASAFHKMGVHGSRMLPAQGGVWFDRTHLYHYIFHEIFRKLPYDMQQFLTDTSVFEKIEVPVCNYALNRTDSGEMLEYLVRENLFLLRDVQEEACYRYDGVFAGFLESRLSASRRGELLLRMANYYARRGRWEAAVRCGMQCGEKGCGIIAAVVEKRAAAMAEAGEDALLREWIDYLCGFREVLTESALFFIYKCLRKGADAQRAAEILYEAAQKAYGKQRYETYGEYMYELAEYTQELSGGSAAKKIAAEACVQLEGRLQMPDHLPMSSHLPMSGHLPMAGHLAMPARGGNPSYRKLLAKQGGAEKSMEPADGRPADGKHAADRERMAGNASGEEDKSSQALCRPVSVQCFGGFIVRGRQGEFLWRTKKTKELFACLFYEKGRWIPRDVLMERLWPEKPVEKAVVLFHTTVSYMRRSLAEGGAERLLLVKERSYALDMGQIESDMELFLKWHGSIKEGRREEWENPEELLRLYFEGYMYGEDYLWIGAYQEHVEQQYLRMLKALAEHAAKEEKYALAEALLRKAVEIDAYGTPARELLIKCLISAGDIAGAKKEYGRLLDIHREMLGRADLPDFAEYAGEYARLGADRKSFF